jgi:DNA-directed RNA polymerase specialized sigma24 family protein
LKGAFVHAILGNVLCDLSKQKLEINSYYGEFYYDAINELVLRWWRTPKWMETCRPNTVKAAVRHKSIDLYRKCRYPPGRLVAAHALDAEGEMPSPVYDPRPVERLGARKELAWLEAVLPPAHFEVLLYDAQSYTGQEIGDLLETTSDAARARLYRARIGLEMLKASLLT